LSFILLFYLLLFLLLTLVNKDAYVYLKNIEETVSATRRTHRTHQATLVHRPSNGVWTPAEAARMDQWLPGVLLLRIFIRQNW